MEPPTSAVPMVLANQEANVEGSGRGAYPRRLSSSKSMVETAK